MKNLLDKNIENFGKYFYKLVEQSQDIFWIKDIDYATQLYISPAYEKVWGLSCESLYKNGTSWFEVVHPEDKGPLQHEIDRIKNSLEESQSDWREFRIIHPKTNEIKKIREISFSLFDDDHQFIGFAGLAQDITQEEYSIELELASHFFRFFAEKAHAVFWARDTSCNKQLYLSP
ncbi:MAG: PAS domain-containing protein, partial [Gammaproteobacteria bacterium]|nr:PAS domain-containing protein [Gammaproteobacteria bacterium]